MEIETESYVEKRVRAPDPAMDRALKAEALAADAIRLMVANMSILQSVLALVEYRHPEFVDVLRKEMGLMSDRIGNIAAALGKEDAPNG